MCCGACRYVPGGETGQERWADLCAHQESEHPAQLWWDWSPDGLLRYMAARRW